MLLLNNLLSHDWAFNCDRGAFCTYTSPTSLPLGVAAIIGVAVAYGATVDRVVAVLVDASRTALARRALYVVGITAAVATGLLVGRVALAHGGLGTGPPFRRAALAILLGLGAVGAVHSLRLTGSPAVGRTLTSPIGTSAVALVLVLALWLKLRTSGDHLYPHATSSVLIDAGLVLTAAVVTFAGPDRSEVERLARIEGAHRRGIIAIGLVPLVLVGGYVLSKATSRRADDALTTRPLGNGRVAMSPRGDLVATTAYQESAAHVWSVDPFTTRELFTVAANAPEAMAFSDDSSRLVTVGEDIRIWDTMTAQLVSRAAFPTGAYQGVIGGIAWSPDAAFVVIADWGSDSRGGSYSLVVDAATGAVVHTMKGGIEIAHAPTGHLVAIQGDARLDVWRYDATKIESVFTDQGQDCGRSPAWSVGADQLLAYRCIGSLRVVRPADGSQKFRYPMTDLVGEFAGHTAWAPDAMRVAFATRAKSGASQICRLAVADVRSGDLSSTPFTGTGYCGFDDTTWSADGRTMFVCDGNDVVEYDVGAGRKSRRLRGQRSDVRSARVVTSRGAPYVLSISTDGVFKSFAL